MDREKLREISRLGGKAVHAQGKAPKWTSGSEEARASARKGGLAVSADRGHMRELSRLTHQKREAELAETHERVHAECAATLDEVLS